ncbi:roadblock/LC7 domain-containing protein [Streptomyces sp. CA-250714]|uniref:roadblock/LC7 domain-containing protein n=1 Tax=Streptomyces sp. CA-250714 TaxID=3240060 RepID=UPI003D9359AC
MNPLTTGTPHSAEARNLRWLLDKLVEEVPGIRSVAVVSSDGLLLLASDPTLGAEHGPAALGGGHGPAALGGEHGPAPLGAEHGPAAFGAEHRAAALTAGEAAATPGAEEAAVPAGSGAVRGGMPVRRRRGGGRGRGPRGSSGDLATLVSGVASLTAAAADLMEAGGVKQTMVSMDEGALLVMAIGDGSLLGVHAAADCDMGAVGYQMGLFVGRAGHVLTPELRSELRGAVGTRTGAGTSAGSGAGTGVGTGAGVRAGAGTEVGVTAGAGR